MKKGTGMIALAIFVAVVCVLGIGTIVHTQVEGMQTQTAKHATKSKTTKKPTKTVNINWRKPSQNKPYPKWQALKKPSLLVSTKNQRVAVRDGHKTVYMMYASTGKNNTTPKGHFRIQPERGTFFYNQGSREGARYWVSFKDHGIYLFHTVPTNASGQYNRQEAAYLGKKSNSHGCVRLSVPDAKWLYQTVPVGTPVNIY